MMFHIRMLWVMMIGSSLLLAIPGNTTIARVLGHAVGHLFSAFLLASIPLVGYYVLYKELGEKEVTLIFLAAWLYLVISQALGF
ncbi:MAG: hypothetical protein NPIRA02_33450 [Nitrospirales bacterium]|nr:MAG: hypothetical protein NPIRA02_33450 [Nitrospirales bacterium]